MKKPVVVIGMGQLGEVFAQGFLKLGHPVYPILRGMDLHAAALEIAPPECVLVAVGEDDLHPVLAKLPATWRGRLGLLQNELLPRDWQRHGLADPTVIVVWFDKKQGRPLSAPLPSPICGPQADWIANALGLLDIPCQVIAKEELLYELVKKALYLLTINIAGLKLKPGATVSELWNDNRELAESVAKEILDIQAWLAQTPLPRERLLAGMLEGFDGDPMHICRGRSAPERLRRALRYAQEAAVNVPVLQGIA